MFQVSAVLAQVLLLTWLLTQKIILPGLKTQKEERAELSQYEEADSSEMMRGKHKRRMQQM